MSLVGNLEDLGLGDILQIVSLSRKSGMLNLTWGERKGRIIFRDGQVVGAESNEWPVNIGNMLASSGVSTADDVKNAFALKKGLGASKMLREILVDRLGADSNKIEDAFREHVEAVVFGFFMWPEGNFSFDLKEGEFSKIDLGETGIEILLNNGMNPQFLAMEGTRLQDEAKRDGKFVPVPMPGQTEQTDRTRGETTAAEAAAKTEPASAPPKPTPDYEISRAQAFPQVLALDDDPEVLKLIVSHLRGIGYSVEGLLKIADGLDRIRQLVSQGFYPAVIVDLFMPRTDGEGILGGLELVRTVKTGVPHLPIMMVSDYSNAAAEKEAKEAGLDVYIDKPKRSQIWGEEPAPELIRFRENLTKIIPELVEKAVPPLEALPPPAPPKSAQPHAASGPPTGTIDVLWDPGKEIRLEIGEEELPEGDQDSVPISRGLHLLKSMITELSDPEFSGQVTLLILRFAAELMNRAVIFLVTKDKVIGLGQFGVELNGADPLRQVRRMRIPLDEPSIFRDVVFRKRAYKKVIADAKWNNYLVQSLGGTIPSESFAAPLITGGKVAAILYGDNVPENRPIGDTDSLEIFLAQAGLSMERTLLERRLSELNARDRDNSRRPQPMET